jgi:lipopolysaccharide export system permease protein
MRILNRYIFKAITGATGLVMLILLALGGFVDFISQLEDVGDGDYDLLMAIQYALLKLPRLAAGMLPASALLGSLLGLGALASGSELMVMRASGISANRMAVSVARVGLALAIFGGVIGEFVAPQMDLYARQMKATARSGGADIAGSSAWVRSGDVIFNIRPSLDGTDYGGVYAYRLSERAQLIGIGRGESVQTGGEWSIKNYRESRMSGKGIEISTDFDLDKLAGLKDLLSITAVRESSLTGAKLWAYVQYLEANGLDSDKYQVALWSRVSSLVGILAMCVLALPFVSGPLRSAGAGARMLIGALIGIGYFFLSATLKDGGAVFGLSPILVAWLPAALLTVIALVGLHRMR